MSIQYRNKTSGALELVSGFNDTDAVLSPTSINPIQNKTVYNALAQKIERTVSDLVNYYDKSQVYNKTEVRDLLGALNTLTIEVVPTLPTSQISSTTIYFVGPATGTNNYDEYVYVGGSWVKIGDTDIDLSSYITVTDLNTVLASYITSSALTTALSSYYTKTETNNLLDTKQNILTFDDMPTTGSVNPVKSTGIKSALDAKQDVLSWDSEPTASSTKAISSGAVKTALDTKQNILTFDNVPTLDSPNPVKSDGIYRAMSTSATNTVTKTVSFTANSYAHTGFGIPKDDGIYLVNAQIKGNVGGLWYPSLTTICTSPTTTNATNIIELPTFVGAHAYVSASSGALAIQLNTAASGQSTGFPNQGELLMKLSVTAANQPVIIRWRKLM